LEVEQEQFQQPLFYLCFFEIKTTLSIFKKRKKEEDINIIKGRLPLKIGHLLHQ
jgi:hypothetical protein